LAKAIFVEPSDLEVFRVLVGPFVSDHPQLATVNPWV
jgi:hypothetical protein